ncbi:MAG TPA: GntP family permease [Methanoculleus sp.]|nr:GntP family permease [Methanoculleus sp.]
MVAALPALAITLGFLSVVSWRSRYPPFLTLIGGALLFALLTRTGTEAVAAFTAGAGAIFALLAIPIFCGAVIAAVIRRNGGTERIISDIGRVTRRPHLAAGVAGYLLSVPMMCCITPFIVLAPLLGHIRTGYHLSSRIFYVAAVGSVVSFVFLYPLPVTYAIVTGLDAASLFDMQGYMLVALPLSLVILAVTTFALMAPEIRCCGPDAPAKPDEACSATGPEARPFDTVSGCTSENASLLPGDVERTVPRRAGWLPVLLPIALLITGNLVPALSFFANINLALIGGLAAAIAVCTPALREEAAASGTKNAGIILFDLCGAGGLGAVIAAEGGLTEMVLANSDLLAPLLVPFLLAALLQASQGSRVVTAIVTTSILAGTAIPTEVGILPFVLMTVAGTMVLSIFTDPYFWLIRRTTGDTVPDVLRQYTLPLSCAGIGVAVLTVLVTALL